MTDTQKHALVMLYLGYITTNTSYSTHDLYLTYQSHAAAVDAVFADAPLLSLVLTSYASYLTQIIITDPNATWG